MCWGGIQWPSRGGGVGRESEGAGRCRGWGSTACPESPARQAYNLSPGRMAPCPRQAGHTERASRGHRQWSVTSQGGHTQTEDRDRLHQGETHSRPGLVRQADGQTGEGKSSRQAGGQPGRRKERQAGRQAGSRVAVSHTQGGANSRPRSPWVTRQSPMGLSERGCCPAACTGWGGRGGCGEQQLSPQALPTEQLAPP